MINECESQQGCTVDGCVDNRHHTLLHKHDSNQTDNDKVVCAAIETDGSEVCAKRPYFMTVPVKVRCGGNEVSTYTLLDAGSQRSFCDLRLARSIGTESPT